MFAELEANMLQHRVKEGIRTRRNEDAYHHGRPPLGFEKHDGYLTEAPNFDRGQSVLELVDDGALSTRKGARELATSRRTITRALEERRELYGLPTGGQTTTASD